MRRRTKTRRLWAESLELRQLLSANDIGFALPEPAAAEPAQVAPERTGTIAHIRVNVNGEQQTLGPADFLALEPGDNLAVEEIQFDSPLQEGIFAVEAYVHKLGDEGQASTLDDADGRFSAFGDNVAATGGESVIPGVQDDWTVEAGWNRLTITLMHYQRDVPAEVVDRLAISLQVGDPDFAFDETVLEQVAAQPLRAGEATTIPGKWLNAGTGKFHNYAEVDIYHASNLNEIVWAGAVVGNASAESPVTGNFTNVRNDDAFEESWIPAVAGEYVLKYYLDPEYVAYELDEGNNRYEIRLDVGEHTLEAEDLDFQMPETIQVVSEEAIVYESELIYFEDFESPEDFQGRFNPNGTDSAHLGQWTVANPVTPTRWDGTDLQTAPTGSSGALVTGDLESIEARFLAVDWIEPKSFRESETNWGFSFKNVSRHEIDPWVAHIQRANYRIDVTQLTNQDAFEHYEIDHGDGHYDHYFVGTRALKGHSSVQKIEWKSAEFNAAPTSDGLTMGVFAIPGVGSNDIDGGVTSVATPWIDVPDAHSAELTLLYNFAYLENATQEDFFRITAVGDNQRTILYEEFGSPTRQPGEWKELSADISEFLGSRVYLLIEAADIGSLSLIEAGVDDIAISVNTAHHLTVAEFTQPSHGALRLMEDGITFEYDPEKPHPGEDSFTYLLTDGATYSNRASVTLSMADAG